MLQRNKNTWTIVETFLMLQLNKIHEQFWKLSYDAT